MVGELQGVGVRVNVAARSQTAQIQNQEMMVGQQENVGGRYTKTALIVGGAIVIGVVAWSAWPVAFGVGYGLRYLFSESGEQSVISAQGQNQVAHSQAQVTIMQGPSQRSVRNVIISLKALKKGLRDFREESFRNMDHRFDRVDQGQAALLGGQNLLLEGQAHVLDRVNYVAHLLEQQQQPGESQPGATRSAEGH